ncbi:MAG: peptidase M48 [Actinobacteria bacterium RBG_16_64_13]|nr:MAG: peptidase M48 [Actinobacteria bacterium RBG_16_64_13]
MNAYLIAALAGVIVVETVELGGTLLNLRALDPRVPAEFADLFDAETYRRSQEYTRARTRLGIVSALFDLAVLLAFWLAGGFGWLDGVVRSLGAGPVWTGLAFLVILFAARGILEMPFSIWAVFVTEERFGFNRTSPGTFILDLVKTVGLSAALEVPLAIAFLALFEYTGRFAWIYAWAAVAAFTFLIQLLAPRVIMPLFNKFSPLEDGELKEAILAYARRVDFPLKGLFSIDASRRSTKGNAFFTGFGRNKRIALFDTLIKRHSTDELVAVLAHEVGHYRKRHVFVRTIVSALETGLFLGLFSVFLKQVGLFEAFGVDGPSVYAGIVFVAVLLRPLQLVLSVGAAALSRHNERQADSFAATTTGRGDLLAAGLKRLSKDNLTNLTPHPFYVVLKYSHPPVLQRLRALESSQAAPPERAQPAE